MTSDITSLAIDQLKDHYKHCIKLSASNKINPKNAFDLQLIDYMQDLVNTTDNGQMNFKIASSALDVGAKIYSNRVDCIQFEAQKVASSILMALDNQQHKENPDDPENDDRNGDTSRCSNGLDESGDLEDGQKKLKKKRNHRKSVKTIVEENVLDGKFDKLVPGDPFLDGLSKDYDMSCPAALICYNALTQPSCLLTIESNNYRKDYRDDAQPYQGVSGEQPITLLTKTINCAQIIRNSKQLKICPRLEEFLFNDRTTRIAGIDTSVDESVLLPNERPNIASTMLTNGPHQFDPGMYDNGGPCNDDMGDDHFVDADSVMGDQPDDDKQENLIPNLDQIAASKPTEYAYSEEYHRVLNTWAGPHAWKALKAPKSVRKEAPKSARKRVKLEQEPINFLEDFDPEKGRGFEKETRFASDTIRKWRKPFYCQDHNLDENLIRSTVRSSFFRPEDTYNCAKSPAEVLKDVDKDHNYFGGDENGRIQEDEANDGYATPMGGFDDVHDDSDDEFRADPIVEGNEVGLFGATINNPLVQEANLEFAGEHLIEQPYTVAQLNIPFAKIAKKMDVRKLKRVMWDLLLPLEKRDMTINEINQTVIENPLAGQKGVETSDKTNGNISMGGDEVNNQVTDATIIENGIEKQKDPNDLSVMNTSMVHLQFSELYGELPVRVSSKMANDLSQPIAFVTLLHLANEKNLKLIAKEDNRDFLIEQDGMDIK